VEQHCNGLKLELMTACVFEREKNDGLKLIMSNLLFVWHFENEK
jgi:hypothetical protein